MIALLVFFIGAVVGYTLARHADSKAIADLVESSVCTDCKVHRAHFCARCTNDFLQKFAHKQKRDATGRYVKA